MKSCTPNVRQGFGDWEEWFPNSQSLIPNPQNRRHSNRYRTIIARYTLVPLTVVGSLDALSFWALVSPAAWTTAVLTIPALGLDMDAIVVNWKLRVAPVPMVNPAGKFHVSVRPSPDTNGSPAPLLLLPGL